MRLNDIQHDFQNLILRPEQTAQGQLPDLLMEGGIPLSRRIKVYQDNIIVGLGKVMAASFPITLALVGQAFFDSMARAFILAHPPVQGCLTWYGTGFDVFIEHYESAQSLPYLADIVCMEIAMHESYYAADDMPLSLEALARVVPDRLPEIILRPRASMRIIRSRYPINAIRMMCEQSDGRDDGRTLDIESGGECIMIYRPVLKTEILVIQPDEYDMLAKLMAHMPLSEAVEAILQTHPAFDFQQFLTRFLGLGVLAALDRTPGGH